jgi:hypothetical protein
MRSFFIFVSILTLDKLRDEVSLPNTDPIENSFSLSIVNPAQKQS